MSAKQTPVRKTPIQQAHRCPFCDEILGRGPKQKTKEHVYPDWLLEEFDLHGVEFDPTVTGPDGQIIKRRVQVYDRFLAGGVCEGCNGGWMRALEGAAKPVLLPLLRGERHILDLSEEEQNLVARWVVKTAYSVDLAYGKQYIRVHPGHRLVLTRGEMPDKVSVFAARHPFTVSWPLHAQMPASPEAWVIDPGHVGLILVPNRSEQMRDTYRQRFIEMRLTPAGPWDYKIGMHLLNLTLAVFSWPLDEYGIGAPTGLHGMIWLPPTQGFLPVRHIGPAEEAQIQAMDSVSYMARFLNDLVIIVDH